MAPNSNLLILRSEFKAMGRSLRASMAPVPHATGHQAFKSLRRKLSKLKSSASSSFSNLASALTSTAGGLACWARPAVTEAWEDDLEACTADYDKFLGYNCVTVCVSRADVMARNNKEPLLAVDEVTADMMQLCSDAAAAGTTAVTAAEARAIKAQGLARYQQHLSQLQANLAAADAAAANAASGDSLDGAVASSTTTSGDEAGSMGQQEYLGGDGLDVDIGLDDLCLEEQQVAASGGEASQVINTTEADTECIVDDCDGVSEEDWEAMLADPEMAAIVAKLQSGQNAYSAVAV